MVKAGHWWYAIAAVCLAGASGHALADSLDEQRQRYQQVKQAWDSNQLDTVAQLMPTLRNYPLYPYLEYRALTQDLTQVSATQVRQFIATHPTLPPARNLNTSFVNELARRQDWSGLLAFSPQPPKPISARCNFYYAQWATGQRQSVWDATRDIWLTGRPLPSVCDKLFSAWQAAGEQTPLTTLERIRLAMNEGSTGLVNYLAKQLPDDYKTISDALITLQNDPNTLESFARSIGPTDFTRKVTLSAFSRVARQDVENARSMLPVIVRLQKMSPAERQEMEETVAWRLMGSDATPEQARWRDGVAQRSTSTSLIERRVRMALGTGDRQGLIEWMMRLPTDVLQKDEWRYWRALVMLEQGKRQEGETGLRALMKERGFYPMAAAQKLNERYPVTILTAAKPDRSLSQLPEITRVRELMFWQMDNLARSEWVGLVANSSKSQQEALARYAFEQRWADLSVQATIVGKLWDHLEERFPLAWNDEFRRATLDKGISQSYAMAIARQESAWNPKARSPVGASGLMQLMPATAQQTARMSNITTYLNSSQLFDPQTNILLGTSYLEYVYQTFGRNRILASAAYNAGPSRVNTWLRNSSGRIDAVAFIESIPFSETRGYVKNVLAYDVFYRYFLRQPAPLLTDAEWQRRY
ncbi:soluble lytic murein transglycosylase|uniref:peptidoglycan lytic exotransglycosylase n=1 Tax=Brenneria salicis ATCC 15712 = DSM 30166 TaxID=714314 RepID=A0A366IA23_9GAMM|nr:murein transglycosylase [Brenneria salicis]NMN90466.1 soluble lytic murein transglycosylase [Brenneria salicis ATCC 15712 = DSM 30166]RBP64793.1 soluble lytic murein transglycosylase [Brenneria salicis ATCC 15712 = DSM 30166]RLM31522.1 murein transglycosylase [Brenneria salicis ATCC 15712 = DSM 30166]